MASDLERYTPDFMSERLMTPSPRGGWVRYADRVAEVEQLERYLFAARASITMLESELKAVSASRDAYAEEVGRLAHKLAALAGGGAE